MELAFHIWKSKNPEKHRIVLLHGLGGTGSLWRALAVPLEEQDFSVLAPDQRGHGKSQIREMRGENPPGYAPLDYGRDVADTLETLRFHPTWILGHSMGVRTACAVAHLRPDWVQGLILIDLGFSGPAGGNLSDNLWNFIQILPRSFASRDEARQFMKERSPDPSIGQYMMAVSQISADGTVTFPFDHDALLETIKAARTADLRGWLKEFGERGMPVLALRGARSTVWSHEDWVKEKEQFSVYPSLVFEEMEGAGHALPFEKRKELVERLVRLMG